MTQGDTHESERQEPAGDLLEELLIECMESLSRGEPGAIEAACARAPEHAAEIRERMGLLLEMNLVEGDAARDDFPEHLDEFRLIRRLGGGGMGVVYEAEQEPLGRSVALKLIRPEQLYFPRARERFRRETEAVAKLQHPGIVSIYTVGEASGVPYYAMEKLAGATLAEVLLQLAGRAPESLRGRDLRAVLGPPAHEEPEPARELFKGTWVDACTRIVALVADALAHAHSRGVLHRDVKPSNVVVTPEGRVVLLDFGLASSATELRMTLSGSAVGSVLYMAPEQIKGRVEEIDERTDIYALGVTLYELVTLQVPFVGEDAEAARAAIVDGSPASMRARNRDVPRELEIVCTTAIDRDRARRYASMEAFARDLRNVLEHRPIEARVPGAALRVARWLQRNPTTSVAVGAAVLLLVGVPSALLVQQRRHAAALELALDAQTLARRAADEAGARAESERRRAELEAQAADQVADYLVDLFRAADPNRSRGREITARELLSRGAERIEAHLAGQPELEMRMLDRLAQSFTNLDLYAEALPLVERALELDRVTGGDDDVQTARMLTSLGKLRRLLGRDDAIEPLARALDIFESCAGAADRQTLSCSTELAIALIERNRVREALPIIAGALAAQERLHAGDLELREKLLGAQLVTCMAARRYVDAERVGREAVELAWRVYRGPHPALVSDLHGLANAQGALGLHEAACATFEEVLTLTRLVHGADSPAYAMAMLNRAVNLEQLGRWSEAERDFRESFERLAENLGPDHPHTVRALGNITNVWMRMSRYREAIELATPVLAALRESLGERDERTLLVTYRLAQAHEALGEYARASELLRGALESGVEPGRIAWIAIAHAALAARDGATRAGARSMLERLDGRCIPLLQRQLRYHLARLELADGDAARADEWLAGAASLPEPGPDDGWTPAAVAVLSAVRGIAAGDEGSLAIPLEDALAELARHVGERHAMLAELAELGASACEEAGDGARAVALRARGE